MIVDAKNFAIGDLIIFLFIIVLMIFNKLEWYYGVPIMIYLADIKINLNFLKKWI